MFMISHNRSDSALYAKRNNPLTIGPPVYKVTSCKELFILWYLLKKAFKALSAAVDITYNIQIMRCLVSQLLRLFIFFS